MRAGGVGVRSPVGGEGSPGGGQVPPLRRGAVPPLRRRDAWPPLLHQAEAAVWVLLGVGADRHGRREGTHLGSSDPIPVVKQFLRRSRIAENRAPHVTPPRLKAAAPPNAGAR